MKHVRPNVLSVDLYDSPTSAHTLATSKEGSYVPNFDSTEYEDTIPKMFGGLSVPRDLTARGSSGRHPGHARVVSFAAAFATWLGIGLFSVTIASPDAVIGDVFGTALMMASPLLAVPIFVRRPLMAVLVGLPVALISAALNYLAFQDEGDQAGIWVGFNLVVMIGVSSAAIVISQVLARRNDGPKIIRLHPVPAKVTKK